MGRNGPGVEMATEEELMTNPRREFLLKAVDVAQLKGLEIGCSVEVQQAAEAPSEVLRTLP